MEGLLNQLVLEHLQLAPLLWGEYCPSPLGARASAQNLRARIGCCLPRSLGNRAGRGAHRRVDVCVSPKLGPRVSGQHSLGARLLPSELRRGDDADVCLGPLAAEPASSVVALTVSAWVWLLQMLVLLE